MAWDDILITLATQLAIVDIRRYVLLKVGAWLLSVHGSMYGRRLLGIIDYFPSLSWGNFPFHPFLYTTYIGKKVRIVSFFLWLFPRSVLKFFLSAQKLNLFSLTFFPSGSFFFILVFLIFPKVKKINRRRIKFKILIKETQISNDFK